jgi:hypothetical protein
MLVAFAISDLSARKDSKIASSTSYLGGADFLTLFLIIKPYKK